MPLPQSARPISRQTIRDEVYDQLLQWILQGELRPGEKLTDHKLAEHLGVSRTPVREALNRLQDKGLVEVAANRWTRVSHTSLEEARQLYPVISSLETLALEEAHGLLKSRDLDNMALLNQKLESAILNKDPLEASRCDAAFHSVIIRRARNHYIEEILDDLKIQHRRLEVQYFQAGPNALQSVREHGQLIQALRKGDLASARQIIKDNWARSLERLRRAGLGKERENASEQD